MRKGYRTERYQGRRKVAENLTFLSQINETFQCKSVDVRAYSPLTLAYIGDAIFDVVIRTIIVERANRAVNQLHKETVKYVKAETQAQMIEVLMPLFTEESRLYNRIYKWWCIYKESKR